MHLITTLIGLCIAGPLIETIDLKDVSFLRAARPNITFPRYTRQERIQVANHSRFLFNVHELIVDLRQQGLQNPALRQPR